MTLMSMSLRVKTYFGLFHKLSFLIILIGSLSWIGWAVVDRGGGRQHLPRSQLIVGRICGHRHEICDVDNGGDIGVVGGVVNALVVVVVLVVDMIDGVGGVIIVVVVGSGRNC